MRRSDREVKDFEDAVGIIKKCDVCRLALWDEEYPYILPLNFGVQVSNGNITLYFHGAVDGKKLDLIRKNNKASFEMDCSHNLITDVTAGYCTMEYESVIGNGTISFVEGDDKIKALDILMDNYPAEPGFKYNPAAIPRTAVYKLEVSGFTAKRKMKTEKAMEIKRVIEAFERNGFTVSFFTTSKDAADYLDGQLDDMVIGFGDSATMSQMKLYDKLSSHNTVYDPNQSRDNDEFLEIAQKCLTTQVFLTSVNAMSQTGEMVNIDGTGNRVAGSLFGHEKVYFVTSTNKIEPTLEKAIWRARNIAAPKNSKRFNLKTPCAVKADRCYDCSSPDRICNALTVYMKKMDDIKEVEILLIDEELGF